MSTPEKHSRLVGRSERVYRALLVVYPEEFRREYGVQMAQLFRDQCREELESGGMMALVGLWFRTLVELVSTARRERDRKRKTKVVGKRDPVLAVVLNLLIWPGLGQIYNLQVIKGSTLIFAYLVCMPLAISSFPTIVEVSWLWPVVVAIRVWSIWDAYRVARKTNASITVG